jgi:hypothetical protein
MFVWNTLVGYIQGIIENTPCGIEDRPSKSDVH